MSMQQSYPKSSRMLQVCSVLQLDPVLYLDADEEMIGCNDALLQLQGFENFAKLQQRKATLTQLFLPEPETGLPETGAWRDALKAAPVNVRMSDRRGSIHYYRVQMRSFDFDERPLYLIILHERTQTEMAKAAKRQYEELMDNLLTNISRQFRTPLNSILGFAGLVEHTDIDGAQREYITHIRDAAESITGTVENLVEMMGAEQGRLKAEEAFFNPMDLYEPVSTRYGDLAQAKKIALLFMMDPRLPAKLMGDAAKITRVMRNLVENAIKFTDAGGQVYVEIRCKECDDERALIEYAVADTGQGIKEEKIASILKPFAAADSDEEKGRKGLGIGLNLSHKLLGVMHSRLRVASKVGRGSRFSFDVSHRVSEPRQYGAHPGMKAGVLAAAKNGMLLQSKLLLNYLKYFDVEAQSVEEIDHETLKRLDLLFVLDANITRDKVEMLKSQYEQLVLVTVITPEREDSLKGAQLGGDYEIVLPLLPGKVHKALAVQPKSPLEIPDIIEVPEEVRRVKILIAEDNPINQKLLTTLLKKENYEMVIANNGQEAVDAYMHNSFDIVLMDIDMPVMDGVTATRLIHEVDVAENRHHTPVIALTAQALPGDRERLLASGLDGHLPKPIDTTILLRVIKEFLVDEHGDDAAAV
jgi:signal transduction histidine kinase/CheY-like chemotaxis protein